MPDYASPPVHEVILDVRLAGGFEATALASVPALLGSSWNRVDYNSIELQADGTHRVVEGGLAHWQSDFFDQGSRWIARVAADRITLNSVRPGAWPEGPYVGWAAILRKWGALFGALDSLVTANVMRAGVRYVNKLGVAPNEPIGQWLTIELQAPTLLVEPSNYQLRHTWALIAGHAGLSANLSIARLPNEQAPNPTVRAVVLDIDVFSQADAVPRYGAIQQWFERAHLAENAVFEACLKDRLRATFNHERAHAF